MVPSVELADVARLAEGDEDRGQVLQRIVDYARSLVPGCTGAGLTVRPPGGGLDVAVTDERVARCHDAQFRPGGAGPAQETLRYGEPRHVVDTRTEERWPGFAQIARDSGFVSCLVLPLQADAEANTALNLYADRPHVFVGVSHDVALLFAAQGGVALDNGERYGQARRLIEHLHRTLVTRSLIERAKGVLMGDHGIGEQDAFEVLRRHSQESERKIRDVAADLLRQVDPRGRNDDVSWTPGRPSAGG